MTIATTSNRRTYPVSQPSYWDVPVSPNTDVDHSNVRTLRPVQPMALRVPIDDHSTRDRVERWRENARTWLVGAAAGFVVFTGMVVGADLGADNSAPTQTVTAVAGR
ncbi:hypothetical protein [Corynebacterium tapiri]|uniref:Uncharacterized protein n=1 Tax=Corynebacterium tapiri TaxID=1448266 RepID=A0A5C4U6D9_9CORY|nr:hypothetical protein [Corynebacterium tapiri]TNL99215.1 hypothetical protein FHE74_02335 [Corynebacterium tapiri]